MNFGPLVIVFAVSVFLLGLLCTLLRADLVAYRYGGVTLAIVLFGLGMANRFSSVRGSVDRDRGGVALSGFVPEREIALPPEK